jgi:hypothetical protein
MSSESTPILSGAIPSFELFMTSWERLADMHPKLERWIKIGLDYATVYYGRMDRTSSYIISMRKSLIILILIAST